MTDLKKLNLSDAKDYDSFKEYLVANGYSNYEKTLADFMKIKPPVESMFQTGAGSELVNMLPPGVENASYLVLFTDFYYEGEQQSGYYFEFDSNRSALSMQSTLVNAMGDSIVANEISDNKLLIGCYAKSSSGGNDQPTRKTISSLSLNEAADYDRFNYYLMASGYSEFEGTLEDYLKSNPSEYSFKMTTGEAFGAAGDVPNALKTADVVCIIAAECNESEQSTGFYAEYADEQTAFNALNDLNENMPLPNGAEYAANEILGNKVLWGMHYKASNPTPPTTSRRTILLRNIIRKSGLHKVEIAAYNRAGEGPRAPFDVQIEGYPFTKDNEEVYFTREGEAVTEMLSCGCMFDIYTNNESKMLPESIQVNNAVGNHYIRYDDLRHGYIEVYEPKGEVQFIFGELPDYVAPEKIKKFALITETGEWIIETKATYWKELPSYDERFIINTDEQGVVYLVFADGDTQYKLHVDYNSEIGDGDTIEVSIEGVTSLTKTLTFMKDDEVVETIETTAKTWAEIDPNTLPIWNIIYEGIIDRVGYTSDYIIKYENTYPSWNDAIQSGTYEIVDRQISITFSGAVSGSMNVERDLT